MPGYAACNETFNQLQRNDIQKSISHDLIYQVSCFSTASFI